MVMRRARHAWLLGERVRNSCASRPQIDRTHDRRFSFYLQFPGLQPPYELPDVLRTRSPARIFRKHICHARKRNVSKETRDEKAPARENHLPCMHACLQKHTHRYIFKHACTPNEKERYRLAWHLRRIDATLAYTLSSYSRL
jgi:hypothetical protein